MTLSWLCEGSGTRESRESRAPKPNISTIPTDEATTTCAVLELELDGPISESDRRRSSQSRDSRLNFECICITIGKSES